MNEHRSDDERLLERLLQSEADTVQPAGDGLMRIQEKISARRSRLAWVRPVLAGAGVAAAGAIAFAGVTLLGGEGGNGNNFATQGPSLTQDTESPEPTPPAVLEHPAGIYPFVSQAEVDLWKAEAGEDHPARYPDSLALDFMEQFADSGDYAVGEGTDELEDGTITVPITTQMPNGETRVVTVVHVRKWADGDDEPYVVVQATNEDFGFTAPSAWDEVASPIEPSGPAHSSAQALVRIWALAPGTDPASLNEQQTAAVPGSEQWQLEAPLHYETDAAYGLLIINTPGGDEFLAGFAAVPVLFEGNAVETPDDGGVTDGTDDPDTESPTVDGLPGSMTVHIGVHDGRIAQFATSDGRVLQYLTGPEPGGGAANPFVTADRQWVYFEQGAGTCANQIRRVPLLGGEVEIVAESSDVIPTLPAATTDGRLAWVEADCSSGAQALVWDDGNGRWAGEATEFISAPRWSPDGSRLAITARISGELQRVLVIDAATGGLIDDGCATDACADAKSVDWVPDSGDLVVLTTDNQLIRTGADGESLFLDTQLDAGRDVTQIDLSRDGSGVFLHEGDASLWVWSGRGGVNAVQATSAVW